MSGVFRRAPGEGEAVTHTLSKPTRDLSQAEIIVIEAGRRTEEEQRRISALTKLAEIEERALRYEEYINSPEWRARAEVCKAAAGYRCRVCNGQHRLNAHHRTYERLGNEDPDDLTCLCDRCHTLYHENRRLLKR